MKKKFNVLVVGFGYWGPILSRNIQENLQFNIYSICDSNSSNLTLLAFRAFGIKEKSSSDNLVNNILILTVCPVLLRYAP